MTSKQEQDDQDPKMEHIKEELTAADFEKELTIADFSTSDLSPWDFSDYDATKAPFEPVSEVNRHELKVTPSPYIKDLPPSTVVEPECPHPPELHIFGPMPIGYFIEHGIDPEGWDILDEI